jgi:hypothetical protein
MFRISQIHRSSVFRMAINTFFAALQANAKLADALGADWGQLMGGGEGATGRRTAEEGGETRRRWTAPEIIRRIGISRQATQTDPFFKKSKVVPYRYLISELRIWINSVRIRIQLFTNYADLDPDPANLRPLF